jgi:DNA-directed RNA polymerase sigma subunit (sigma70/sigma32)
LCAQRVFNEIGREPTPQELGMPTEKVRKVLHIIKEPLSLETFPTRLAASTVS